MGLHNKLLLLPLLNTSIQNAHFTVLCNVITIIGPSDMSLETTRIQVRPMGEQMFVVLTFLADEVAEEVNESLTLELVPTPATLQIIPIGEGVFFKHEIPLIIMDNDRKL